MKSWYALLAAVCVLASCAQTTKDLKSRLGSSDSGTIWFASAGSLVRTPDGSRFVPGNPVTISGDLQFPVGAGPFPAVILAHGCAGPGNADASWAIVLREWGYATLVVDSARGRGMTQICTNPRDLTPTQRIPDVYGGLRIAATHPRIDARRMVLMGFSHGGDVALRAATQWAKDTYAPPGQPSFRAFFPFYGFCAYVYPERQKISAPVRVHHGEKDDWLPVGPCIRLVETLKASGQDATITVYPGARHSFDNVSLGGAVIPLPLVLNATDCTFEAPSIVGPFPSADAMAAITSKCVRRGATVGWDPEATEQARRNVRAQLAELLK